MSHSPNCTQTWKDLTETHTGYAVSSVSPNSGQSLRESLSNSSISRKPIRKDSSSWVLTCPLGTERAISVDDNISTAHHQKALVRQDAPQQIRNRGLLHAGLWGHGRELPPANTDQRVVCKLGSSVLFWPETLPISPNLR